jgi:hypothetical protein
VRGVGDAEGAAADRLEGDRSHDVIDELWHVAWRIGSIDPELTDQLLDARAAQQVLAQQQLVDALGAAAERLG